MNHAVLQYVYCIVVKEAVEAEKKRMEAEIASIQKMGIEEQTAHFIYKDISENILNLRCPRCKHPFLDFDGCFALTCHCRAAFCAWCLTDCGTDAHAHLGTCREGNGLLYGTKQDFAAHHRSRRERLVREKITSVRTQHTAATMGRLREMLARDLHDLGIHVDF